MFLYVLDYASCNLSSLPNFYLLSVVWTTLNSVPCFLVFPRSRLERQFVTFSTVASVCPGRDVAFCSELSPTILEDSGDGFLAQTDCDTLRFLQSLSSCQVRQGYWTGQATPNRDGNVETSLLWSTGSDTCICHDSHDARRCFDEGSGPLPFVACGNERTSPRVLDLRIQHRCEDNIADALRDSQNGDWLSADSISRTFWIRASLKLCSVSLTLWPR